MGYLASRGYQRLDQADAGEEADLGCAQAHTASEQNVASARVLAFATDEIAGGVWAGCHRSRLYCYILLHHYAGCALRDLGAGEDPRAFAWSEDKLRWGPGADFADDAEFSFAFSNGISVHGRAVEGGHIFAGSGFLPQDGAADMGQGRPDWHQRLDDRGDALAGLLQGSDWLHPVCYSMPWAKPPDSNRLAKANAIRYHILMPAHTSAAKRAGTAPKERRLRHRVMVDGKFVFGPGKADILAGIAATGSLAAAARSIGMSYMRAWTLVQAMQKEFTKPVVDMQRGGRDQGAKLTPTGEKALALYLQMEGEALAATAGTWRKFNALMRHIDG